MQGREVTGTTGIKYMTPRSVGARLGKEAKLATSLHSQHGLTDRDVGPLHVERPLKTATGMIMPAPVWRTATGAAYIRTRRVRPNEDGSVDRVFVSEGASMLFWKSRTYRIVWERAEL